MEGFYLALGVTVVLPFAQWLAPAMPRLVAYAGMAGGILIMFAEFLEPSMKPPFSAVILCLIGVLCIGGAAHLYIQSIKAAKAPHDKAANLPATNPAVGLSLLFETRDPYETSEISNGHVLSRVKIGLKASGRVFPNCKVFIEKIAPQPKLVGGMPILLGGGDLFVRPDDPETLIDIASQWDHMSQFRFSAPIAPVYGGALNYLDDNIERTIEIKIRVGTEFQKIATFKIWTDASKKLHLKQM
jgi:hypothetical protein